MGLITYSPFVNDRLFYELESMRANLSSALSDLYAGIIIYEKDVLAKPLPFFLVNQLVSSEQNLDLTQLIEHMILHATDFFQYKLAGNSSDLFLKQAASSDAIFYRMNVASIYTFS